MCEKSPKETSSHRFISMFSYFSMHWITFFVKKWTLKHTISKFIKIGFYKKEDMVVVYGSTFSKSKTWLVLVRHRKRKVKDI